MVICCVAPNCTNRQGKGKRGAISFHRFPLKDSARLYLWTVAIQRSDWNPGPYSFLCSEHFSDDSFVPRMPDQHPLLRPDAVPSLFKDGREIKTKRALVLRLGKRKPSMKKLSALSMEDKKHLVSPGVDSVGPPLNPAVAPLAWMLGTWISDPPGKGEFPSIPPFCYMEEAVISHVGQPMLNFTFCASNPETGKAMHRECGFIRVKPGTNQVAFICAQNIGVVEVEEGEVHGEQLTLTSHSLSRISFAKEPHVQQISRTFCLTAEGKLEQTVSMATATQAMAPHLQVTYKKVTS
ncbi:peroxynitrite isomerase THAP4 isoform X2 [Rhinoderma darwinii]|uniref:peroxynitrite isomerase THAP4 isoform X2 n=1 Tax=Rhinoderma darwinii TaxID=43563 RepID=UPI003F66D7F0